MVQQGLSVDLVLRRTVTTEEIETSWGGEHAVQGSNLPHDALNARLTSVSYPELAVHAPHTEQGQSYHQLKQNMGPRMSDDVQERGSKLSCRLETPRH